MTLTLSIVYIPVILTLILLIIMFRPYRSSGTYDFGAIFRSLWLIPILVIWMVYFGISSIYNAKKAEVLEKQIQIEKVK